MACSRPASRADPGSATSPKRPSMTIAQQRHAQIRKLRHAPKYTAITKSAGEVQQSNRDDVIRA